MHEMTCNIGFYNNDSYKPFRNSIFITIIVAHSDNNDHWLLIDKRNVYQNVSVKILSFTLTLKYKAISLVRAAVQPFNHPLTLTSLVIGLHKKTSVRVYLGKFHLRFYVHPTYGAQEYQTCADSALSGY